MSDNVAIAAIIVQAQLLKQLLKTANFKITTFKEAAFKATAVQSNVWQCCNYRNYCSSTAFKATVKNS